MAQYAPEFLASLKHRYEKTDQPMIEMAREFGIGITTLQMLVDKQGWEKRSQRLRGLPRAMRLQHEAEALAAAQPPKHDTAAPTEPVSGEVSERAFAGCGAAEDKNEPPTPAPSPPLVALAGGGETAVAGGAERTAIERLEALVVQEIADLESARELRGGKRVSGAGAERTAQALASLTRTLQTIRTMRGETSVICDDDMPEDIDAFRLRLAKKIEDFLERRKDDDFSAGIDPDEAAPTAQGELQSV